MVLKTVAVRFPEDLYRLLTDYVGASQTKIAPYCRHAVYESTFSALQRDRSRLQVMKNVLEQLQLSDDQKLEQKREIRDLEAKVARFEDLWSELAAELYGTGGEDA